MKRMIKRALAMVLALMLAVPAFTLAEESEGFVPPVEEWEEVEISLGDDAASDDSGETGAPIEEEAPPERLILSSVRFSDAPRAVSSSVTPTRVPSGRTIITSASAFWRTWRFAASR